VQSSADTKVEQAIRHIREGGLVIIADDEDRENEGDLVCAADKVTPEIINFMATHGRGLVCLTLAPEIADRLDLPLMSDGRNSDPNGTAFTVSIDATIEQGVSTGISAADRARTIQVAVDPTSSPADLIRPGHIFPLRAKSGGVLQRVGQTEASVDIARLADCAPAGVICEILNADGTMARRPELEVFSRQHGLPTNGWCTGWPRRGCRRPSASFRSSATRTTWTTGSISRSSWATSNPPTMCSSGFTRSVSPGTCSAPSVAIARFSFNRQCGTSPPRAGA